MLDGLPLAQLLDGFGTVALVVLFGAALATRRIVIGRTHEDALAEQRRHYDAVIEMKDQQIRDLTTSAQVSSAQVTKLLEVRDIGLAVATSIQREAQSGRQEIDRGENA